jgi:hypothetical protein
MQTGGVADTIINYAQANQIDLIAMCTHGRTGRMHWTLGSVADRVLRAGHVPVLGSTQICGVKTALTSILTTVLIKSGFPTLLLGTFWQSSGAKARRGPLICVDPLNYSHPQT